MYTLSFQYYGGDVYFLYTISPEWNVDSQLLASSGGPLEVLSSASFSSIPLGIEDI